MERESFVFYKSFYEAIRGLQDNIRLEVFTAITEYALYGKLPENLKPFARGMFTLIKPNLDISINRYESGKKGGRKPDKNKVLTNSESSDDVSATLPDHLSVEEEAEQLRTDQIWFEPVCMQFHIDKEEFDKRLNVFVTHCKVERSGAPHSSIKDAKRHFISWMRKAYPQPVIKSDKTAKSDDYTFNGGFGGLDV